jgi:hypothetical protein
MLDRSRKRHQGGQCSQPAYALILSLLRNHPASAVVSGTCCSAARRCAGRGHASPPLTAVALMSLAVACSPAPASNGHSYLDATGDAGAHWHQIAQFGW